MAQNTKNLTSGIDPLDLLRPNIRNLKPYRSARDDFKTGVLLDANENPFQPETSGSFSAPLNRYPDPHYVALRNKIAEIRQVNAEQIFIGNGSDEAIELLIKMFCTPGEHKIGITSPTYGMYKVSADTLGVDIADAPLKPDFTPDVNAILELPDSVRILFLCSPNNPSSNLMPRELVIRILDSFPGIVAVDEAYIDFAKPGESMIHLLDKYPRLVVLQTLSKAWGLAGLRLGMAFSSPAIMDYMMRVKPPYNVNALSQEVALRALSNLDAATKARQTLLSERDFLANEMNKIPGIYKVHESDANFLLFRVKNAPAVYRKLADRGVIVRYRGDQLHCEDGLRVSVGTPEENRQFINVLAEILTL
ncbi:MAG: histidinol-phosphate transaminase [Balneolales bacterium]|nr:histidinol-phosphate transaminase [Balneolales bacterium]